MNNIEILEEFLEDYIHGDFVIQDRVMKAIESIIQENKELKEENIKYETSNDYLQTLNQKYYEDNVTLLRKNGKVDILADNIHFKYIDVVENYIPKSKVTQKIQELEYDQLENLKNICEDRIKIQAYKELLEEGE